MKIINTARSKVVYMSIYFSLLLLFFAVPAWAGELEELKKRIEKLEKAQKRKSPFYAGYSKGLYIKSSDEKYKLRFRFLIQPQYEYVSRGKKITQVDFLSGVHR